MLASLVNRERGVSLLELLIVIALLVGLIAVGATNLMHPPWDRAVDQKLLPMLIKLRDSSRTSGSVTQVSCTELATSLGAVIRRYALQFDCQAFLNTRNLLQFFPDGSTSGALLVFTSASSSRRMELDWLTGRVAWLTNVAESNREN